MTTQYLYHGLNVARELSTAGNAELLSGLGVDDWFGRTQSSATVAMMRNALGSTIGLVNAGVAIATSYGYEPFRATAASGAASSNSYQFTGRELDPTGLYYLRNRYYNPMLGRFLSPDPVGIAGGINLYAYTFDDPMNWVDPSGLITVGAGGNWAGELYAPVPVFAVNDGIGVTGGTMTGRPCQGPGPGCEKVVRDNPERKCVGAGRGLAGNPEFIGRQGGIPGQIIESGTAAVIPQQFGVPNGKALAPAASGIHGTIGQVPFSGATDIIGGKSPIPGMNVRLALQQLYPGQLILEIQGAPDQGENAPVTIFVPQSLEGCPTGTGPVEGE